MAVAVLMYHGTPDGAVDENVDVPLDMFRAQIGALLDAGTSFIGFGEARDGDRLAKGRHVCVTFDDGNANNLPAIEFLHAHGIRATQFVVARWSEEGRGYRDRTDYFRPSDLKPLSELCDIGGHGATHRALTSLDDRALAEELAASRDFIAETTGIVPTTMSFPGGDHDGRVIAVASRVGFELLGNSVFDVNTDRAATINRLVIGADSHARTPLDLVQRPLITWTLRKLARRALGRG